MLKRPAQMAWPGNTIKIFSTSIDFKFSSFCLNTDFVSKISHLNNDLHFNSVPVPTSRSRKEFSITVGRVCEVEGAGVYSMNHKAHFHADLNTFRKSLKLAGA